MDAHDTVTVEERVRYPLGPPYTSNNMQLFNITSFPLPKSFNWTITPACLKLAENDFNLWEEPEKEKLPIKIVHSLPTPDSRGFTVAWRKTSEFKNSTMVDVAVAYCAPGDTFNKKVGAELARRNLLQGKYVTIPARNPKLGDTSVPANLRRAFSLYTLNSDRALW